jgi:hypothetical protein
VTPSGSGGGDAVHFWRLGELLVAVKAIRSEQAVEHALEHVVGDQHARRLVNVDGAFE